MWPICYYKQGWRGTCTGSTTPTVFVEYEGNNLSRQRGKEGGFLKALL
jgi:hypothetical protein